MTTITINVPDLSGAADVDVIEVMVKVGDVIAEGDSLIAVETDKAAMEVPAPQGGTVVEVLMGEGVTCSEGDAILVLSTESAAAAPAPVIEPVVASPIESPAPAITTSVAQVSEQQVNVPDMSGAADVDVIEVMVKVGDVIKEGDGLIAVETDKASMEVPSPHSGTVVSVTMKEGVTCSEGDLILTLSISKADAPEVAVVTAAIEQAAPAEKLEQLPAVSAVEEIKVPDMSGASDVDVIEVMVKAGDTVAEGDSLITVETDKASMEVPAPKGGTVIAVSMTEGSTCSEGDVILTLQTVASVVNTAAPAPAPAPAPAVKAPVVIAEPASTADKVALEQKNKTNLYAGPVVRLLAREFGVDLTQVRGTGNRGRILKEDIQAYVKKQLVKAAAAPAVNAPLTSGSGIPQVPEIDYSQFGEIEMHKLSKVARLTRDNMSRAWLNVPHVTQFDEADITDLESFRKGMKEEAARAGVRLTPMPFIIKAVAKALKEHPRFNAALHADGQHLVLKKYVNIGIAVDTPNGLMVPVIKDADKKSLYELANEAVELAGKAKDRKLKPNEMQGACFTISSLGGLGGTGFTPIVNTPEVAILGISKADIKPRWNGKEFEPRQMLPLCLSYDHRAINGGDAGRFMTYLNAVLSDIRRLTL